MKSSKSGDGRSVKKKAKRQVTKVPVNQTEKYIVQNEVSDSSDDESQNIGITFVPDAASLSIKDRSFLSAL